MESVLVSTQRCVKHAILSYKLRANTLTISILWQKLTGKHKQ